MSRARDQIGAALIVIGVVIVIVAVAQPFVALPALLVGGFVLFGVVLVPRDLDVLADHPDERAKLDAETRAWLEAERWRM